MTSPGSALRAPHVSRQLMLFHAVLGAGLFVLSLERLIHALHNLHGSHIHLAFVGGVETLSAVLFLIPRTIRWGGSLLLLFLLGGFVEHLIRGAWQLDFLIYSAGVWFVMTHGPTWGRTSMQHDTTA